MHLIDLNPRWVVGHEYEEPSGTIVRIANNPLHGRRGMGMSFECPIHSDHRILVWFKNPIDGLPAINGIKELWHRDGAEFAGISLSPSINVTLRLSCWHGFIQNGEIV